MSHSYLLFLMGGVGSRFGSELPKQFTDIDGKPLYIRILKKLSEQNCLDGIVVVVNAQYLDLSIKRIADEKIDNIISVVAGGRSRSESVMNGLEALLGIAGDDDVVLMHDATHPYVDKDGTEKVIRYTKEFGSATLVNGIYDTAYTKDAEDNLLGVAPRSQLAVGASPEGFLYRQIYDIYKNTPTENLEKMTSVGAIALANNIPMKLIPTKVLNLKITQPEDMEVFMLLRESYFKI